MSRRSVAVVDRWPERCSCEFAEGEDHRDLPKATFTQREVSSKKQKEENLKLRLNRETLVPLNADTLEGVNGGLTPTWTLTTTVTIAASHRWITCS